MGTNRPALKRGFRYDPVADRLGIHFNGDEVAEFRAPTDSPYIWVTKDGDDTRGTGARLAPVASLTQAFTLVTTTRKIVEMGAGEFAEAAAVVWPTVDEVKVRGAGDNLTTISATGTSVITVTPGVQTGTWEGTLEDVHIDHSAGTAQSGITFDNTAMTKKLIFNLRRCSYEVDTGTDKCINVATHGDTGNAIRIYVTGDGTQMEIEGAIYFLVANNSDRLHFENCWLVGTITTSVTALEFRMRLFRCVVPHEAATAGGNGLQYITSVNSYSWIDYDDLTPEVYAALDTTDLAGSHSEVIVD